jgi:hypothetical protein
MATLLLSVAGAAAGALFGPVGTIVGRAAGALIGAALDRRLFGDDSTREVGKLSDLDVQSSSEGAPIPRVYGRVRISGEVIWATRLEEQVTTESAGGKALGGGPEVESHAYFGNFAVALCEGPIAMVGRVWANGRLLDRTRLTMRVYRGTEGQGPDSLIEAKQGSGRAPAYRGTAYVVFERLPLAEFGNALPQLSFEVIRVVGHLEPMVRAVTLIPGATEFGYAPETVTRVPEDGVTEAENRHVATAESDVEASLDELQALLPNLEAVSLVVAWFGSDLRAGECRIVPKVEFSDKPTEGGKWRVAGLAREDAELVSRVAGRPAYGGTPSDASVVALIRALRDRGLKVTLYPFVMMDVPADNDLPDPWTGGDGQPAYPWRGRITCDPAPGRPGTADKTGEAADQIADFVGMAEPGDFSLDGEAVVYSGPAEWGFRRMILHYAALCDAAGGVDCFLVGSELRGLTVLRDGDGDFPFVGALRGLVGDVRSMLGGGVEISYAADWSEYFGHQPADGTGDVFFHLDPLWADDDVDFVGIDNYFPLSDWREGDHLDGAAFDRTGDLGYLRGNVVGGEGYDWYYSDAGDRAAQLRTPITDGGAGKPWVFRTKDLANWWGRRHRNRPGGVESGPLTGWLAGMKPIRFTELGCPAVDKGPNEPNAFYDALSSEGRLPYFSDGGRDDGIQRRYLEAMLGWFDPGDDAFAPARNPLSPVDGRRMLDWRGSALWTWDSRPFPVFPLAVGVWTDGPNWARGHWLTGRFGAAPLDGVVAAILADHGVAAADTREVSTVVDGCVVAGRVTARSVLEPLAAAFGFSLVEQPDGLAVRALRRNAVATLTQGDLVEDGDRPLIEARRAQEGDLPAEVSLSFFDVEADFRQANVTARRPGASRARVRDVALPVVASSGVMAGHAEVLARDLDAARDSYRFTLPPSRIDIEPGDVVALDAGPTAGLAVIERIEDGGARACEARAIDRRALHAPARESLTGTVTMPPAVGRPRVHLMDLPILDEAVPDHRPWVAAAARPWPGDLAVLEGIGGGFRYLTGIDRPATVGRIEAALAAGPTGRFDRGNTLEVTLLRGVLGSASEAAVFAGANACAIATAAGGWEVLQFRDAELVGPSRYRISTLLRGQLGTESEMAAGHDAGAAFVLLDRSLVALPIGSDAIGRPGTYRIGPATVDVGDRAMAERVFTPQAIGRRPFSPAHLFARRVAGGDIDIRWIRRTRLGGDVWDGEVPLGESEERYRLRVFDGGDVVRVIESTAAAVTYAAAEQTADFGAPPAKLDFGVAQLSPGFGPGPETRRTIRV